MANANEHILTNLLDGSRESFEVFFRAYYQDLFIWAYSIVEDKGAAEDCVQEFFLDMWENKRVDNIRGNIQSYIYRSVKNYCLNYLKRDKKMVRDTKHLNNKKVDQLELSVDKSDNEHKIYSAINLLPEKSKEVFMYCCVYGYTYKEAAEELGVSINTVRTHITRAFRFLREKLKLVEFVYFFSYYRTRVYRR